MQKSAKRKPSPDEKVVRSSLQASLPCVCENRCSDGVHPPDIRTASHAIAWPAPTLPLLGLAQAGAGGFFDPAGFPTGEGWDQVQLPQPNEPGVYALEVSGDSMLPLYRDGDRVVVSINEQVRRGDRVVVRTRDGEVMAKVLARQTANVIELHSLNPLHPPRLFDMNDVEWIARIIWASQ